MTYNDGVEERIFAFEVNPMKMNDAIVLVTGANRGLGRALVHASLNAGARRVYAGARALESLDDLHGSAKDRVVPLSIDITDSRSLAAAAERARDVTIVINNAGVLASNGLLTSTTEAISQDFATNTFGLLAASRAFLPALERAAAGGADRAALVNVLSVVSLANMPGLGGYSASKAAAYSITQGLRAELAKKLIRVHAVFAGAIDTDMVRTMEMPKTSPEAVAKSIVEHVGRGIEDIAPDPMSRDLFAMWKRDPKELEKALATMGG